LLEASIEGARGILLNIAGGSDLGLFEANEAAEIIHAVAHPDANIIFGAVIDDEMDDEVRVTVIAAGFERWEDGGRAAGSSTSPNGDEPSHLLGDEPPVRTVDIFADAPEDELDLGDDDEFDVPSFLR
jgi:cell division protein FtsZ